MTAGPARAAAGAQHRTPVEQVLGDDPPMGLDDPAAVAADPIGVDPAVGAARDPGPRREVLENRAQVAAGQRVGDIGSSRRFTAAWRGTEHHRLAVSPDPTTLATPRSLRHSDRRVVLRARPRRARAAPLPRPVTGRSALVPYLYVLPLVVLLAFVFGYPIVKIVEFSFKMVRGIDGPWIGFRNYQLVLSQPLFWESVRHNLFLLLAVPAMLVWSLLIAVVLSERVAGWKLYRVVLFLPYILAIPIVAVVMRKMFQLNGPVNETLRGVGLDILALDWIGSSEVALWTVMILIIWRESALGILLFLARLLALDESLTEQARLDGAGWWQRLWYVTIPQMRGVIEFFLVISVITILSAVFAYVYMMGGGRGGPGTSTMVVELYIFNALIRMSLPGVASAVSVMLFLVSLVLIVPLFLRRRRADEAATGA